MAPFNVVVWDKVGNVTWGMRSWNEWDARSQAMMLDEDPQAASHVCSIGELFAGEDVHVIAVSSAAELATHIADADVLIAHKVDVPADVVRQGKRLRLVQHLGLDYRGIPLDATRALGVPVTATPLVNYIAVAEHVWALVLNHVKRLPAVRTRMVQREYGDSWGVFPQVRMVRDLTLGLLGMGEIGRQIARVAQAFEMPVVYWDITRFPELEQQYNIAFVPWEEVFRQADVLSVQLALNEQTEGIVGAREIGSMKPDALFINTARGKLVDQAALTAALQHGVIGGAALDVFDPEPLPADDPLHALHEDPRAHVTLTPHNAWQSPLTWVRDSREIWDNVRRIMHDEPLHFVVDKEGTGHREHRGH